MTIETLSIEVSIAFQRCVLLYEFSLDSMRCTARCLRVNLCLRLAIKVSITRDFVRPQVCTVSTHFMC